MLQSIGSPQGEGALLSNLARVLQLQRRFEEADELLRRSLAVQEQAPPPADSADRARTLLRLGDNLAAQGHLDEAEAAWREALGFASGRYEAKVRRHLGQMLMDRGKLDDAQAAFSKDLEICRHYRRRGEEAKALDHLGLLHAARGQFESAMSCFESSLHLKVELGDPVGQGAVLRHMAELAWTQERWDEAGQLAVRAVAVLRDTEDHAQVARLEEMLSRLRTPANGG